MNAMILCLMVIVPIAAFLLRGGSGRPARWQRDPLPAGSKSQPRTILVTGATGFIGQHLCRSIIAAGDQLIVLTRDRTRALDLYGPHATVHTSVDEIDPACCIDSIVNLAGAPIFARAWTARRRRLLIEGRMRVTEGLIGLIERLQRKPRVLISASAIGYYGVRGDEELSEMDRGRTIFQSQLCQLWELAAQRARASDVRVCNLRLGMVLGRDGGALPRQIDAARLHLATVLGSGRQWMSWIHIEDLLRLIWRCIESRDLDGPINATSPSPVRQETFALRLASQFGRSLTLRIPEKLLRWILGERAQLLVDGQRVLPVKALCADFTFRYRDIDSALADLCPRPRLATPDEILYDSLCPVCDAEMTSYRRSAQRLCRGWQFGDVATRIELMNRYRIDLASARKRVYVLTTSGTMVSGMEAICTIWAGLPFWRVLAWLCRLPLIRPAVAWLYDVMLAPLIWRWNQRRRALTNAAFTGTH